MSGRNARATTLPSLHSGAGAQAGIGLALAAVLFVQLLGALIGSNWLWGVATLGGWSPGGALALTALAAAGFVPLLGRPLGRILDRLGRAFDAAGGRADLGLAVAVFAVLFAARDPLRFVGDSSMRMQTIAYPRPPTTLFPQASPLDLLVNFHLPRALHHSGWPPETALQAVGASVGAAFAWVVVRTLRASGARGVGLLAGVVVGLAGAHLLHFAGYDKFGPLLLGIALAALGSVRLSRGAGGAAPLAIGTAIAVLSHRSGMLVVPPAAWIAARAWRADPSPVTRRQLLLLAPLTLAALAMVMPNAVRLFGGLDLRVHMPGGAVQASLASPDAPAWLVRASDFLNGLLMAAPLAPAGLAATIALRANPPPERVARFGVARPLALALALQAALLVTVGATRGSGRDWDVATPAGVLAAVGTAGVLARSWQRDRRGSTAAVTLALAVGIGQFGVHTSEASALRRVASLLHARPAWSPTARAYVHDFLGLRAFSLRRFDEATAEFERAIAAAPNPRFFLQLGSAHASAGRARQAIAPLRRGLALDPTMREAWLALANAAWTLGDSVQARAVMDSAVARLPGDAGLAAARRALGGNAAPGPAPSAPGDPTLP